MQLKNKKSIRIQSNIYSRASRARKFDAEIINIMKSSKHKQQVFLCTFPVFKASIDIATIWIKTYKRTIQKINAYPTVIPKILIAKKRNIIIFMKIALRNGCIPYNRYDEIQSLYKFNIDFMLEQQTSFYCDAQKNGAINLMTIRPLFFAKELTRQTDILFKSIEYHKLIDCAVSNDTMRHQSVKKLINIFNKIGYWIPSEVFNRTILSDQKVVIKYFIKMAKCLYKQNSYHCLLAVIAGLHNNSITRLPFFEIKLQEIENLKEIMSETRNYKNYREHITAVSKKNPCVPYLGSIMMDITHFYNNYKDKFIKKSKINFFCLEQLYKIFVELDVCKKHAYKYKINAIAHNYFYNMKIMNESALYKKSRETEKKFVLNKSKKRNTLFSSSKNAFTQSGRY